MCRAEPGRRTLVSAILRELAMSDESLSAQQIADLADSRHLENDASRGNPCAFAGARSPIAALGASDMTGTGTGRSQRMTGHLRPASEVAQIARSVVSVSKRGSGEQAELGYRTALAGGPFARVRIEG